MKEILLGVNIDHIAILRNARGTAYPDPVHNGQYAEASNETAQQKELDILIEGIQYAHSKGLKVNAGHAIIARAAFDGLHQAVTDVRRLMQEARA